MSKQKIRVFKMADSGVEVWVKPVSPAMVSMNMLRSHPKPLPRLEKVDMGDGDVTWERNYTSDEYNLALSRWADDLSLATGPVLIYRAVDKHFNDEEKAELQALRGELEDLGVTPPKSDKMLWFMYVACQSDSDFESFVEFLQSSGEPDQEVVESIQDGFPSNVQGGGRMEETDA